MKNEWLYEMMEIRAYVKFKDLGEIEEYVINFCQGEKDHCLLNYNVGCFH